MPTNTAVQSQNAHTNYELVRSESGWPKASIEIIDALENSNFFSTNRMAADFHQVLIETTSHRFQHSSWFFQLVSDAKGFHGKS